MQLLVTVNGTDRALDVDPRDVLLDVLRDELALTGAKKGCGAGNCGACTVLLEGQAVYACLILAVDCDGEEIVTIEGLAQDNHLDPVQQAFVNEDAMQCGFCTPGQVVNVKALADRCRGIRLSDDELKRELTGNLCRCGAYRNIHRAAREVLESELCGDGRET